MRAELQPVGELENLLVDRVVSAVWRLRVNRFYYNESTARLFYQVKQPLRPGWHRAKIVATDSCGPNLNGQRTKSWGVTVLR